MGNDGVEVGLFIVFFGMENVVEVLGFFLVRVEGV